MQNNKELDSEALALRREYYRRWKREHKERVREYNADYWRRKAEKLLLKGGTSYDGDGKNSNADGSTGGGAG